MEIAEVITETKEGKIMETEEGVEIEEGVFMAEAAMDTEMITAANSRIEIMEEEAEGEEVDEEGAGVVVDEMKSLIFQTL